MKVVRLKSPAGITNLQLLEEGLRAPKAGEVLVRLRASSLSPHDDFVVRGIIPAADGLGADDLIHYRATPAWGEKAKALTGGRGVDHVIEVGGPATFAQSMAACRLGGHIALIGVLSGFAGEVLMPALFSGQIRVSGISIGSRADQEDMIRAIEVNGIKPVIDTTFALADIAAVFACYQGQDHFGKVSIEI